MRCRVYSRISGTAMFHDVAAQAGAPSPSTHSGWLLRNAVRWGRSVAAISSGRSGSARRSASDQKWLSFIRTEAYTPSPIWWPRRTSWPYRSTSPSNIARRLSARRMSRTEKSTGGPPPHRSSAAGPRASVPPRLPRTTPGRRPGFPLGTRKSAPADPRRTSGIRRASGSRRRCSG